jgi:CO/xanthine dehydrogenase FAD-binding subunit
MFTRPFRFCRADDLAEASELLRRHGEEAKVIAGGQSLMPLINLGLASPSAVIDISRAGAFAGQPGGTRPAEISYTDGYLTIGALVTHARLATDPVAADRQPLLGAAAARIGNPRVRNRGTLGGSLAHSDPAAELPLAMTALGAEYEVSDGASSRTVRAEDYHLGFLTTALEPDELVIAARVPALGPGWGWAFEEFSRRDGDFALAAAAALVRSADTGPQPGATARSSARTLRSSPTPVPMPAFWHWYCCTPRCTRAGRTSPVRYGCVPGALTPTTRRRRRSADSAVCRGCSATNRRWTRSQPGSACQTLARQVEPSDGDKAYGTAHARSAKRRARQAAVSRCGRRRGNRCAPNSLQQRTHGQAFRRLR